MFGCLRLTSDICALLPFVWDAANDSSPSWLVLYTQIFRPPGARQTVAADLAHFLKD